MATSPERERSAIRRLAREYKEMGYDVITNPGPGELPAELTNHRVDLLAKRPGEAIIVNVKTRETLRGEPDLQALAKAVASLPGWRFEFVLTNPRRRRIAPDDAVLPHPAALAKRLDEAAALAKGRNLEAALLLAWSASEGILRTVATHEGVDVASESPASILKRLYSLGLMAKSAYEDFQRRLEERNALIHGFTVPKLNHDSVSRFIKSTQSMMTGFDYLDPKGRMGRAD